MRKHQPSPQGSIDHPAQAPISTEPPTAQSEHQLTTAQLREVQLLIGRQTHEIQRLKSANSLMRLQNRVLLEFRWATADAMSRVGGIPLTDRLSAAFNEYDRVMRDQPLSADPVEELTAALGRLVSLYETEVRGDPTSTIASMRDRLNRAAFAREVLTRWEHRRNEVLGVPSTNEEGE